MDRTNHLVLVDGVMLKEWNSTLRSKEGNISQIPLMTITTQSEVTFKHLLSFSLRTCDFPSKLAVFGKVLKATSWVAKLLGTNGIPVGPRFWALVCWQLVEYLLYLCWAFPSGSNGKESACNAGEPGSIPGSGRSLGQGNGYPLWYSCLGNPMDRGAWQSQRVRHDWMTNTFHFHFTLSVSDSACCLIILLTLPKNSKKKV